MANDAAGWQEIEERVRAQGATPARTRLVMEATGASWQGAATALHRAGWRVYVAAPASVRHDGQAQLRRATTDAVDAALLIDSLAGIHPPPWQPAAAEIEALQLLVRQRALAQLPSVPPTVHRHSEELLGVLGEQIGQVAAAIRQQTQATAALAGQVARLQTIAGVGLLTAAIVVAETRPLRGAANARAVVVSAGLDPAPQESGTSVRGARQSSKTGNARLRQAVSRAARAARRYNPLRKPFSERLRARGKRPRVAVVAVVRKRLALMTTLLIHERDFDPEWHTRPSRRHA